MKTNRAELEREVARCKGVADRWNVFKDEGISGAFGREVRAQYDAMLKQGVQAKYDVVLAWDVSRGSEALSDLGCYALDELHACGIDLYLHQQAVDNPLAGKALFRCGVLLI